MQSEPRNAHIPILRWSSPVLPMFGSWTAWVAAWVAAWSATAALLVSVPVGGAMVFHGELVHEEQGEQPAHDDLVHADEEARDHHRHREAEQDRPERAGRHMDGRDLGGGDGIDHSSVRPSHGSGLATLPARAVLITFPMNTRNESAIVKAPMVETRFQKFQPRSPA